MYMPFSSQLVVSLNDGGSLLLKKSTNGVVIKLVIINKSTVILMQ